MRICDLHTHSVFSDGTFTPAEIIKEAENNNISAVALCDHNTMSGCREFFKASKNSNVIAVPGVEFSADFFGTELHILGLFIDEKYFDYIDEKTQKYHELKEISNINLVKKLNENGYKIDYDYLKCKTPDGLVNRAHIASELTKLGYTKSNDEAFKTILSKKFGLYVPPKRIASFEVLEILNNINAVSVLAHPLLNLNKDKLNGFLKIAKEKGLKAIETRYSLFSEEDTVYLENLANEFGLLKSGGSDFHGLNKPDINLGTGKGNLIVPFEYYEKMHNLLK